MRLLSRIGLVSLVLTLAFSLGLGAANAASKKKTKKVTRHEEQREVRHESHRKSITGTNIYGRAGLLYGDTSDVMPVNQVEGAAHFTYQSLASASFGTYSISSSLITIPVGAHFGAAKNIDIYGGVVPAISSTSSNVPGANFSASSTNFTITAGGKYKIAATSSKMPDFSVGGDISMVTTSSYTTTVGPLSVTVPGSTNFVFTPRGTISYTLESGMLLNGELGIAITSGTYVMADAGVGIPLGDKFVAIGEIGANQAGNGGSVLALGGRMKLSSINLQALLGVPLNGGGVQVGAGLSLSSI